MKTRRTKSKRYPLVAIPERSGKKLRLPRQKAFKSEYIQRHGCSLVAECIALQWWGIFKPMTSLQKWHKKHTPDRYHPKVTVEAVAEGLREIARKGEDEVVFYRKVTVERIERSINRGHLVIVEWGDPIHTVVLVPDTGGKCYLANHGEIRRYSPETAAVKATTNKKYRGMIICKDLERGVKR